MLLCIYKYFYVCLNKLYTPDIMSKLDTICIALNTNLCSYIRERELCIALNTICIIFVVIYEKESSA